MTDILYGLAGGIALSWMFSKVADMRRDWRYQDYMRRRHRQWQIMPPLDQRGASVKPNPSGGRLDPTFRPDWSPCSQPPNDTPSEP